MIICLWIFEKIIEEWYAKLYLPSCKLCATHYCDKVPYKDDLKKGVKGFHTRSDLSPKDISYFCTATIYFLGMVFWEDTTVGE